MKKIDVLILVEHVCRELEGSVLLKLLLEKKGFSVKIVSVLYEYGSSIVNFSPKLIITPWCYDDHELNILKNYRGAYKDNRFKVLNMHHEQVACLGAQNFLIPKGQTKDCYHIAWGNYSKNLLLNHGIKNELVRVTGSPRLDFFKKELRSLSKSKEDLHSQYNIDISKKWILILGNFSFAFFDKKRIEELKFRGILNADLLAKESLRSYKHIIKWMKFVLENNQSNINIIYRPHPSEPITNDLLDIEKKNNALHVIKDFSVRDWLVNSDLVFVWNSTASIESIIAKKPTYALRPFPLRKSLQIDMLKKIPIVSNKEMFDEIIKNTISNQNCYKYSDVLDYINNYYVIDNTFAANKIASFIVDILKNNCHTMKTNIKSINIKLLTIIIKQYIKKNIYKNSILNKYLIKDIQKQDYITDRNILELTMIFREQGLV